MLHPAIASLRTKRLRRCFAVLAAAGIATIAPGIALAAAGPLRADGRYLVDPEGRVVILHGLFAVWKQPPYFPAGIDSTTDPSTPSFTDADADEVQSFGLDGVRLSWYWEGLEPTQGHYSTAYLSGIAGAEQKFASRGIYVVLDAHQDQYDQLFGNEPGFPEWSAVTGGQPVAPEPSDPGYAAWKFPLGYFHTSTELAFGNLYANTAVNGEGIRAAFGRAWQVVVRRFDHDPMVAGYDLINEPFPGTTSQSVPSISSCSTTTGCPNFDRHTLEPFQVAVARAIRGVDPERTVFFEPTFFFNIGVPTHFTTPPAAVAPVGLSFHDQCPSRTAYSLSHDPTIIIQGHTSCPPVSAKVLRHDRQTTARLGGPGLMTEVASTSDNDVQGLNCLLDQADRFQAGWTYGLSWSNPEDELRRLASESAPTGAAPFKQMILARVYPRAVAGIPERYSFNVRNGRFRMTYIPRRDDGAPTIISIPVSVQYPDGYVVHVRGARQVSRPDASKLALTNLPDAKAVSLTVGPAPGSNVSRPQFPACPSSPPAGNSSLRPGSRSNALALR
jgi:endoglycosylceramidase